MIPKPSANARGRVQGRAGAALSPEYREVVEATIALLQDYRLRADKKALAPDLEPGIRELTQELWQDWRALWSDAAQCLLEIAADHEHLRAAKEYTQSRLTPELLDAPLWRQAYTKPHGYPGDYEVMEYIYEGTLSGRTPFARLAHGLGIHIGQFVVRRKEFVRQAIAEVAAQPHRCDTPPVIVSLGCGPAREVAEFLRRDPPRSGRVSFMLVDQDTQALRCAGRHISEALAARRHELPARVDLRHLSVLRLLREVDPSKLIADPAMIYSAGLFDYFSDRTCRALSSKLYQVLRPGGLLLLGNMKAGTDMIWPLEMIADWSLIYRTAESVLTWAEGLHGAEISLRTEATGYDYLLSVRKQA